MARTDWLGDMGTGFGKAVLGIALNFGVFFVEKSRMARIDWGGWESATHGKDMEKKGEGRRLRKDGQGEE